MFFYFMDLKPENYGFLIFNDNNAIIKRNNINSGGNKNESYVFASS